MGPNPNNGNFFFSVNGIEKETIATLYTIDGKQIKQFRVVNLQQQNVNGIRSGIYLLKIPGFETQKIIVNGGGNAAPQSTQSNNNINFNQNNKNRVQLTTALISMSAFLF